MDILLTLMCSCHRGRPWGHVCCWLRMCNANNGQRVKGRLAFAYFSLFGFTDINVRARVSDPNQFRGPYYLQSRLLSISPKSLRFFFFLFSMSNLTQYLFHDLFPINTLPFLHYIPLQHLIFYLSI